VVLHALQCPVGHNLRPNQTSQDLISASKKWCRRSPLD
jgi:hypothetical protein